MRSLAALDAGVDSGSLTPLFRLCVSFCLVCSKPLASAHQLLLGIFGKECVEQEWAVIRFGPPARPSAGTDSQPTGCCSIRSAVPLVQPSQAQGESPEPADNARKEGRKAKSDNCEQIKNLVDAGLSPVVTSSRLSKMTCFLSTIPICAFDLDAHKLRSRQRVSFASAVRMLKRKIKKCTYKSADEERLRGFKDYKKGTTGGFDARGVTLTAPCCTGMSQSHAPQSGTTAAALRESRSGTSRAVCCCDRGPGGSARSLDLVLFRRRSSSADSAERIRTCKTQ